MSTKAERNHLERVANMGCIVCREQGLGFSLAECHHIRAGKGSTRAGHYEVIPLCPPHHRTGGHGVALHAGRKTWEKNFGAEAVYLTIVLEELGIISGE